jgi:hypothetical protein
VLRGAGVSLRARLQKPEPRRWLSDGSIRARLRVPSTLAAGQYQLALWLPDAAPTLEAHSEYAIQLANTDVWDDVTGENTLGSIEVSDDAPGTAVNDAADLAVIAE